MSNDKKISAVGIGVPATDKENLSDNIISDLDGKIKSKIFESIYQHDDIVGFRTVTDNSIEVEYRDGTKDWYTGINCANGIRYLYNSIKEFIY